MIWMNLGFLLVVWMYSWYRWFRFVESNIHYSRHTHTPDPYIATNSHQMPLWGVKLFEFILNQAAINENGISVAHKTFWNTQFSQQELFNQSWIYHISDIYYNIQMFNIWICTKDRIYLDYIRQMHVFLAL